MAFALIQLGFGLQLMLQNAAVMAQGYEISDLGHKFHDEAAPAFETSPRRMSGSNTLDLKVESAGFEDGNYARFYVNGTRLSVTTGTGMNVVVLRSDGGVDRSGVFDTHGAGSEDLVSFINSIQTGRLVLVAVRDDANGNISTAAKNAIKTLGSTNIDNLSYRGAFALIGIKGGSAVAEKVLSKGNSVARITAVHAMGSVSPVNAINITVSSAGWADGNFADFYVDGSKLTVASGVGMNVILFDSNGMIKQSVVFNTRADGSPALAAFIQALSPGSLVAVAAKDDANTNISTAAKLAIKTLGATKIDDLKYRSAYALVGVKGGAALAEETKDTLTGAATVTGLYRPGNIPYVDINITVRSSGWADKNLAEFYVDGGKLNVAPKTGVNIAVLQSTGTLDRFGTFNTHAAGSEALVTFVDDIATGSLVLLAVKDEARANMSTAAKTAIKSLGATLIDSLTYRGAYCLIGVKGGSALAEDYKASGNGNVIAEVNAKYSVQISGVTPSTTTTTTTTTTTMPPSCATYVCERGWMLKLQAASIYPTAGQENSTCCEAAEAKKMSIQVESAGWADGNFVKFKVDGKPIKTGFQRGLHMVVLKADGRAASAPMVFDTRKEGSYALAQAIQSLENGTVVLVAARDEVYGGGNLNSTAKDALRLLGATKVDSIRYRSSYALIGVKGGVALAEIHAATKSGPVAVVARADKKEAVQTLLPVCDAKRQTPPVAGWMSNGMLNLEEKCRYHLWDKEAAGNCLKGGWFVNSGGSNSVLGTIHLANLLAPDALEPIRDGASMGSFTVLDVIIEDGQVIYRNASKLSGCSGLTNTPSCEAKIEQHIAFAASKVPYKATATRITHVNAQFWDHVGIAVKAVTKDQGWAAAKLGMMIQVSAWYIYCSVKYMPWCPRKDLLTREALPGGGKQEGLDAFVASMDTIMALLKPVCSATGRAKGFGCIMGTNSFQGITDIWYEKYNAAIVTAAKSVGSGMRIMDLWTLGKSMPEENIGGHGSPVHYLWGWQIMLSGICPAELAAKGTAAKFKGETCFADQASYEKCPAYERDCPNTFRCEKWECASSVPCEFKAEQAVSFDAKASFGLCADPIPNTTFASTVPTASANDACYNNKGLKRRVWCPETWQLGWSVILTLITFLLAAALIGVPMLRARLYPPPPKAAVSKAAKGAEAEAPSAEEGNRVMVLLPNSKSMPKLLNSKSQSKKSLRTEQSEPGSPACTDSEAGDSAEVVLALHGNDPNLIPTTTGTFCTEAAEPKDAEDDLADKAVAIDSKKTEKSESKEEKVEVQAEQKGESKEVEMAEAKEAVEVKERPDQSKISEDTKSTGPGSEKEQSEQQGNSSSPRRSGAQKEDTGAGILVQIELADQSNPDLSMKKEIPVTTTAKLDTSPAMDGPVHCVKAQIKKEIPKFTPAGHKYPLGLARFLGSCHVVVGHLYAKGVTASVFGFGWGFTWVPWFFMLSGFVLFSAWLKNPKPETMFQYVMRRSVTIYPLYAFSLIPAFAISKGLGNMSAGPGTLIAQSFLLQAWWPGWTESSLQMHCWFLSCMVVYWFFFKPFAHLLKDLTLCKTISLMAFLFFLPWLTIIAPAIAGTDIDWYKTHKPLMIDTAVDFGVVMLKFHPVCYVHVFLLGMLLAKLRQHLDSRALAAGPADSWRNPYRVGLQFVAPLGYLMILLVFNVQEFNPVSWGYKISARISVLLPFQAMILFGLAGLPSLPLPFFSQVFQRFDFLEQYSYCVYVFQFIFYALWPQTGEVNLPLFMVFTIVGAIVMSKTMKPFVEDWWKKHERGRLVVPFVLALVLALLSALPDPKGDLGHSLSEIPEIVRHDNEMHDVRLGLQDLSQKGVLINPSLAIYGGQVVVVARRHRHEVVKYLGTHPNIVGPVQIIDEMWYSDIMIGNLTLDATEWKEWPEKGGDALSNTKMETWTALRTPSDHVWSNLCSKDTYIEVNHTVIRKIVTGPEDPKILVQNGKLVMSFDSLPPSEGNASACRVDKKGWPDAVPQAYQATNWDFQSTSVIGRKLNYGRTDKAEKNWIPFVEPTSNQLQYVYKPFPQTIVSAQSDGSSSKLFDTTFLPLKSLLDSNPGVEVRGSAQAVLISSDQAKNSSLPEEHFLGLLHLYHPKTKVYQHYAYRFGAVAPYMMLQLSSKLPLTEAEAEVGGQPFAFASGLAVYSNETVVITYGAGDRDARALVMSFARLDRMFGCMELSNSTV